MNQDLFEVAAPDDEILSQVSPMTNRRFSRYSVLTSRIIKDIIPDKEEKIPIISKIETVVNCLSARKPES